MKLDEGFLLRDIAGEDVLVPIGSKVIDFKGLMTFTPVGAFICRKLQEDVDGRQLLNAILEKYDVSETRASKDLEEFLERLRELGALVE